MGDRYIILCVTVSGNEFDKWVEISEGLASGLEPINVIVSIFLSIVTGVSMIFGMRYLKSLKEKKLAASFSFWSQIKLKIIRMHNYMLWNKEIINNFYSVDSRLQWEENEVTMEQLQDFKKLAKEILEYLDQTEDQMPAYNGWSKDMLELIDFLSKVIQYDICKNDDMFFTNEIVKKEVRDAYYADICRIMQSLIEGIQKGQSDLEKDLFPLKGEISWRKRIKSKINKVKISK